MPPTLDPLSTQLDLPWPGSFTLKAPTGSQVRCLELWEASGPQVLGLAKESNSGQLQT